MSSRRSAWPPRRWVRTPSLAHRRSVDLLDGRSNLKSIPQASGRVARVIAREPNRARGCGDKARAQLDRTSGGLALAHHALSVLQKGKSPMQSAFRNNAHLLAVFFLVLTSQFALVVDNVALAHGLFDADSAACAGLEDRRFGNSS